MPKATINQSINQPWPCQSSSVPKLIYYKHFHRHILHTVRKLSDSIHSRNLWCVACQACLSLNQFCNMGTREMQQKYSQVLNVAEMPGPTADPKSTYRVRTYSVSWATFFSLYSVVLLFKANCLGRSRPANSKNEINILVFPSSAISPSDFFPSHLVLYKTPLQ